jgi:hypothetical protein
MRGKHESRLAGMLSEGERRDLDRLLASSPRRPPILPKARAAPLSL